MQQPDNGSTVVYEPVRPRSPDVPNTPAAPAPLMHPSAPAYIEPARNVVEVRRGGSVVRYEPILDYDPVYPADQIDGDSAHAPSHTSPSAPIEDEPDQLGSSETSEGLDLPLEDRPSTTPPVRSTRPNVAVDPAIYGVHLTPDGLALPYPTTHMFRGFGACRGHRHRHEAIDLGGVGPDWGVGTPIRSMARAEVIFVGQGDDNPADFGTPDKRDGESLRGDKKLPRWKDIEPYGRVYFFTSRKGRWRSGNLIITRVLDGPLQGHTIRYLHIADVHPDVKVGAVVARGQEIAVMGGTGVQEAAPHLHLDIQAPDGHRLDVAPLLGLEPTASCRARADDDERSVRTPKLERSRLDDPPKTAARPQAKPEAKPDGDKREPAPSPSLSLRDIAVPRCKANLRHEDFTSGRFASHTTELKLVKGQKLTIEVGREKGNWKPRLQVEGDDVTIRTLATGRIGAKAVSTVTANDDTSVRIKVGGWTTDLPGDAAYGLRISEKCRGRR